VRHEAGGKEVTGEWARQLRRPCNDENRPKPNKSNSMKTETITTKKRNWMILAGCGFPLLVAAHGLVAWGGIKLSDKIGSNTTLAEVKGGTAPSQPA
jgi:hypothetical protein